MYNHYYVNKLTTGNPHYNHEVHKESCIYLPSPLNREYLGYFSSCKEAISKAKENILMWMVVRFVVLNVTKSNRRYIMGKNQHVTHRHDGNWQVKGAGNSKATVITSTQKEAIKIATNIARNQKSELVVHGLDGRIREKNSYGNDPFPPKG